MKNSESKLIALMVLVAIPAICAAIALPPLAKMRKEQLQRADQRQVAEQHYQQMDVLGEMSGGSTCVMEALTITLPDPCGREGELITLTFLIGREGYQIHPDQTITIRKGVVINPARYVAGQATTEEVVWQLNYVTTFYVKIVTADGRQIG